MVGAVVVKGDKVVGEGYHYMAGTPHAEIHALKRAGSKARGADLYVTMEPCCHHGRTPPCVEEIVRSGIKNVYIGTKDPNPIVNGKGVSLLKKSGIKVATGILQDNCRSINEPYNKHIVSGIPYVTAKVAMTLDGKIATKSGDSKWITNGECRKFVHRVRGHVDAVMVGGGTVRKDDPRLNVRIKGWRGRQPLAIVVDESLNLPRKSKIFKRARGKSLFATTVHASKSRSNWISKNGFELIQCRSTGDGNVFLPHLLNQLGEMGITSILLEGGGELFSDFMKRDLIDKLIVCFAPKLVGGNGKDFLPGISIEKMKNAFELRNIHFQTVGDNFILEGSLR